MINIAIFGYGRMGSAILSLLNEINDVRAVELYERDGSPLVGQEKFGIIIQPDSEANQTQADVLVDFTEPFSAMNHFYLAVQLKKPIIVGTTGLSKEQLDEVRNLSKNVACLFAPNLSLGVNLLYDLVKLAAQVLPKDYDITIVEAHHRHKLDAPSGTAYQIARLIETQKGEKPEIHSIRAGEIVGEHRVIFAGPGETIELSHSASSRRAFAAGVVQAVRFLYQRQPGLYFVGNALGLR
ncbi:MAG: 4-hydroxy-tetrahydrodipicolinate reductase [bacterium]|nr:4-hydroxy-tetrahydrodipicolinate reductase [bacterium]